MDDLEEQHENYNTEESDDVKENLLFETDNEFINYFIYKSIKLFVCNKCHQIFKTKQLSIKHSKKNDCIKHNQKLIIDCVETIERMIDLQEIILYPCLRCNKKTFIYDAKLERHINCIKKCNPEPIQCKNCLKIFYSNRNLRNHNLTVKCIRNQYKF
jgi:hypothetical protein